MKVFIFGSEDFPDLDLVKEFVKKLPPDTILLSVRRKGVNNVALNQACFQQLTIIEYPRLQGTNYLNLCCEAIESADEVYAFVTEFASGNKKRYETDNLVSYAGGFKKLTDCIIQPIIESEI